MNPRFLGAFVVVLSLTAPPLVGLACAWACQAGTHHLGQAAGHNHGDMDLADVQIVGRHVCSHDFDTVELYGSAKERRPAAPDGIVAVAPSAMQTTRPDQHSAVGAWSPLDDRVLSPPARSLVLRI